MWRSSDCKVTATSINKDVDLLRRSQKEVNLLTVGVRAQEVYRVIADEGCRLNQITVHSSQCLNLTI